ncbi:hypothetical protein M4D49_27130 [Cupriavidus pauculus]|uniref:hypothetical protein n=1 Tax=Burkholderiaceae TaxID=119060 RepID=UPI000B15FCA0|nr:MULTISPECIES: hypothetical protein [Burkholderiaceae]MCM3609162.1 hypothetical protein [Cupriavidus pauculus]
MAVLKLSQLAGLWSKDPLFIRFLNRHVDAADDRCSARYGLAERDLDPAGYIRQVCRVESRRDLDTDARAVRIFNREIRAPFMEWAQSIRQEAA